MLGKNEAKFIPHFSKSSYSPTLKKSSKEAKNGRYFSRFTASFSLNKSKYKRKYKGKKGTKKEQKYEKKKQKNFAMRLEKSLNIFKSELKNTVNLKRNKLKFINTKHRFFSRKKLFIDHIFLKKEERNFSKI